MAPEDVGRRLAHGGDIQRAAHRRHVGGLERRDDLGTLDRVTVFLATRVGPRVERLRGLLGAHQDDVDRQTRVEAAHQPLERDARGGPEARHLAARVHTGVGAPGPRQPHRLLQHAADALLENALDGRATGLQLPAGVAGAHVRYDQLQVTHVARPARRTL